MNPNTASNQTIESSHLIAPTVFRVEGLIKIYGKRRVVDGVSFHVNRGEIVGLLGPNGAGKTTSFRMSCGLIDTNGGIVYLGAQDVTNWPMYRRSREGGMGYLPQDKCVFQKLSVQNNLLGVMEMLGMKRAERLRRCDELLEKFGLNHLRRNLAGGLSGGERRRLEIARALVSNPKIILLDEPFAAVDPITVTSIQQIIRNLAGEGISILITDHSVPNMLEVSERCYVIEAGKVLCHGTPAEVVSNPEAQKVYFGDNVGIGQTQSAVLFPSAIRSENDLSISPISDQSVAKHSVPEKAIPKKAAPKSRSAAKSEPDRSVSPGSPSRILGARRHKEQSQNQSQHSQPQHGQPPKAASEQHRQDIPQASAFQPHSVQESTSHGTMVGPNRPLGKRLVPSSSTTTASGVRNPTTISSASSTVTSARPQPRPGAAEIDPDRPAPASSGVIRALGTLIWGKE